MRCVITAGPTWEPLDRVRRLTNSSTGSLGGDLANALAQAGHDVVLLLSESATWRSPLSAVRVDNFATTDSLAGRLQAQSMTGPAAVFHAAAVSDYQTGAISSRGPDGLLSPLRAGKVDSRAGPLFIELVPTPKILPQLREWFPDARITGWKFEVDGTREEAVERGYRQLTSARSDACVVNGPACGSDYVWLRRDGAPVTLVTRAALLRALVAGV